MDIFELIKPWLDKELFRAINEEKENEKRNPTTEKVSIHGVQ